MSAMSNYLENKLNDHALGTTSYTMPTQVYVALYLSDPTDADSGTEVTAGAYARIAVDFGASSGGVATNTNAVTFTASGGNYGTVTHVGLRDASTSGNLLFHGPLSSSRTINDGESLVFEIGSMTNTLA